MNPRVLYVLLFATSLLFVRTGDAADEPSQDKIRFFESHVRPLLVEKCSSCHDEKEQSGGLILDGHASLLAGGESGPAIEPGNVDASLFIEAIRYESYEMPPDGKLSDREVSVLEKWVADGAVWPGGKAARQKADKITDEDREFWAFQPVADPAPPQAGDKWAKGDLDRFVAAKLDEAGLAPNAEADRRTLVRRAYQTVVGLPPTPEQVDAFVSDPSPMAYSDLVDELLASPRHGEHAATFWLDVVRFAESDGYRADHFRPHSWRYRDYVIKSFNDDKPYSRFIAEQLAGDELYPGDLQALTATNYLKLGIYEYNQRDVRDQRSVMLADITDTTGDAMLGMGMGCARCHDHKFDPILQRDYYRLQAFFANLSFDESTELATTEDRNDYARRLGQWEEKAADLQAEVDALYDGSLKAADKRTLSLFTDELQSVYTKPASERTPDEEQIAELIHRQVAEQRSRKSLSKEDKEKEATLKEQILAVAGKKPADLPRVDAAHDVGSLAPVVFIPGKERLGQIEPGFLTILDEKPASIAPIPDVPHSTGRRATLAQWLTRDDHPLVPRVIINRIWQQHFGAGLVSTVSDFGHLGERPSHPELLDHLTTRFVESGWSLKQLRREILLSATFRQASALSDEKREQVAMVDPDNRLLSHFAVRRLAAEQVRDAMLAASGELRTVSGGKSVSGNSPQRSVYVQVKRNSPDHVLAAFDMPDRITSMGARNQTMTPTQALLLINNQWATKRAVAMAKRVEKDADPVESLYRLAFGRLPTELERNEATEYLKTYTLPPLAHILLNTNEFLFVE